MAQLLFRCPYTNRPIRPGIEMVPRDLKALAGYPISVECPHCGSRHNGTMGDGCLVGERALAPNSPKRKRKPTSPRSRDPSRSSQ